MTQPEQQQDKDIPEERVAIVKSIRYMSTLAIVTFTTGGSSFQLIGDRRMIVPISEFINESVRLLITSQSEWSWQPLDDPDCYYETNNTRNKL